MRRLRLPVKHQLEIRIEIEEIQYFEYQNGSESQSSLGRKRGMSINI